MESTYPPDSGKWTPYLKISYENTIIYHHEYDNDETVQFMGICRDPRNQLVQIILKEDSPHRGESSHYTFIYFDTVEQTIKRNEIDNIVKLQALVDLTTIDGDMLSDTELKRQLNTSIGTVPECQWGEISSLHEQISRRFAEILRYTTATPFFKERFNNKKQFTNKSYPINSLEIPMNNTDLVTLVTKAIKNGDSRYFLDILDADENQEIIVLGFYESIGVQLAGSSSGLLLRIDKKHNYWQPLFCLEQRPYPYGGLCVPQVWMMESPTILKGWLAEGTQPCKFYPIEIDLKIMKYYILSDQFAYDTFFFINYGKEDPKEKQKNDPIHIHSS